MESNMQLSFACALRTNGGVREASSPSGSDGGGKAPGAAKPTSRPVSQSSSTSRSRVGGSAVAITAHGHGASSLRRSPPKGHRRQASRSCRAGPCERCSKASQWRIDANRWQVPSPSKRPRRAVDADVPRATARPSAPPQREGSSGYPLGELLRRAAMKRNAKACLARPSSRSGRNRPVGGASPTNGAAVVREDKVAPPERPHERMRVFAQRGSGPRVFFLAWAIASSVLMG